MAQTSVPTNARVITYEKNFYREYVRSNRYSKYIGSDEMSPIQMNEKLTKTVGETITWELVNRLVGNQNTSTGSASGIVSGVTGYNRLKGNEEAQSIRTFQAKVALTRWAVTHLSTDEQFSAINLVEAKRATLQDWFKENIRDRITSAWGSISADGITHYAYASASEANKDTWLANNSDRVVFGSSNASAGFTDHSADLLVVDTTNDTLTKANLQALKDVAKSANPKIKPIKVNDEEEWFVVFTGTKNFRVLQTSLGSENLARVNGGEAYKDNPIFNAGDLIYDGLIIREIPEIAGLGAVGASSALVQPAYLVGAQAAGYGVAQRSKMIEDEDDYGEIKGAGIKMLDVVVKMYFGAGASDTTTPRQNGVATGYYAYT
jgi:hypothetical protein